MERPLRPEEASLEQGAYLAGAQGQFACHLCPQFLGMGPTHSPLKKLKVKTRETRKNGSAVRSMYL